MIDWVEERPEDPPQLGEEYRVVIIRDPHVWKWKPWKWAVFQWDDYRGSGAFAWRVVNPTLWTWAEGASWSEEKARVDATRCITYIVQVKTGTERSRRKRLATRSEIKFGVHELTTGD